MLIVFASGTLLHPAASSSGSSSSSVRRVMQPEMQLAFANSRSSYLPPTPPAGFTNGTCTEWIDDYTLCELALDVCYAAPVNTTAGVIGSSFNFELRATTPNVPEMMYIVPEGKCLARALAAFLPKAATLGNCTVDLLHGESCTTADRTPPYVATCTDGVLSWTDPPLACNLTVFTTNTTGFLLGDCSDTLMHGESCTFEVETGYASANSRTITCYQGMPLPSVLVTTGCPANSFDVSSLPAGIGPGNCLDAFAYGEYCILELISGSGYHTTAATPLLQTCVGGAIYPGVAVVTTADVSGAWCIANDLLDYDLSFLADCGGSYNFPAGTTCTITPIAGYQLVSGNLTVTCGDGGGFLNFPHFIPQCGIWDSLLPPGLEMGNCTQYMNQGDSCLLELNPLYELAPGSSLNLTCLAATFSSALPTQNPLAVLLPGNCAAPDWSTLLQNGDLSWTVDTSDCGDALANGASCTITTLAGYGLEAYIADWSEGGVVTCVDGVLNSPLPLPISVQGCTVATTTGLELVNCTAGDSVPVGTVCALSVTAGYELLPSFTLTTECLGSAWLHFPQVAEIGTGNSCGWRAPATRGVSMISDDYYCLYSGSFQTPSGSSCVMELAENWTLREGVNLTIECTDGRMNNYPLTTDFFAPCDVVAPIGCTLGTCGDLLLHNQSCSLDCYPGVVDGPTNRTCINGGFYGGCNHRLSCYGHDLLDAPVGFELGTCTSPLQSINTNCELELADGYQLTSGSFVRTCFANGTTTPKPMAALVCAPGSLVLPLGLEFGSAATSCNRTATSGSTCELQLASGYLLESGSTTFTCSVNGTWFTESPPIAISTACMTQSVSLAVTPRYVTRATPVELSFTLGANGTSCSGANADLDSEWTIHDVNQPTDAAIKCRSTSSTCTIPSGVLVRGSTYAATLRVRFMESIAVDVSPGATSDLQVTLTSQTGFVVQPSKLRVGIVAPTAAVNVADEVTLDATSVSDDPDSSNADLAFAWQLQCAGVTLTSASGSSACDLPNEAAVSAALSTSDASAGRLIIPANSLLAGAQYHLTVRATTNDGTGRTAQHQTVLSTLQLPA